MDKEKFRTYRVYLLAAALIMLWLLFALLSRCGRSEAVSDGRDTVSRNACIFRENSVNSASLSVRDTGWKDALLFPVKKIEPNKPPNVE
jgi:hypothetical protein